MSLLLAGSFGCASSGEGGASRSEGPFVTADGLEKTAIDMRGSFFLRKDHGIGSYDAFLLPAAAINYKRRSRKLPAHMEAEFLATLEQSLADLADDANIPVVNAPGDCVMQIGLALYDVEFASSKSAETLGKMKLVMEYLL